MKFKTLLCLSALALVSGCNCGAPVAECLDKSDCTTAGKPFCGRPGLPGVCVECFDDSNCPSGLCLPDGVCGECGPAKECAIGQLCGADGKCVSGCASETASCPDGGFCLEGVPVCVECLTDSNCPAGKLCSPSHSCTTGCNANHPCPAGQQCDLQTNQCVQCLDDTHCSGATPRCEPTTQVCVECLPGPGDNCSVGEYCRADFRCERGCKNNAACPSGVCLPNHSCQGCTSDSQCAAGMVCANGTCIAACSATNPCGTGNSCCSQHCVDQQTDPLNCGGCGTVCATGKTCCGGQCVGLDTAAHCGACAITCGANQDCCSGACTPTTSLQNCGGCGITCGVDQFCDAAQCVNRTFPNFCANKMVYAIYDGIAIDDAATNAFTSTIQQNCSSTTVITYGPQSNPAWVDQTTGGILLGGGTTVVTAGGPFPNKPVKWLERTSQVTKVYFSSNGIDTYSFRRRSDDAILASMTVSQCSSQHDRFVVELATDPGSGALALIGYGICNGGAGTQAAAYFWSNVMLPDLASYPDSWYLVDWTDNNSDSIANAGDIFTVLVSGL